MARRFRPARWLKWFGAASCALIAAAFGVSVYWQFEYVRACNATSLTAIHFGHGIISVGNISSSMGAARPGYSNWRSHFGTAESASQYFRPDRFFTHEPGVWVLTVPLWMLFVTLLLPTLVFWYLDRRRPPPGHCPRCGYNLTGLTSGRCPECGAAASSTTQPA